MASLIFLVYEERFELWDLERSPGPEAFQPRGSGLYGGGKTWKKNIQAGATQLRNREDHAERGSSEGRLRGTRGGSEGHTEVNSYQ